MPFDIFDPSLKHLLHVGHDLDITGPDHELLGHSSYSEMGGHTHHFDGHFHGIGSTVTVGDSDYHYNSHGALIGKSLHLHGSDLHYDASGGLIGRDEFQHDAAILRGADGHAEGTVHADDIEAVQERLLRGFRRIL